MAAIDPSNLPAPPLPDFADEAARLADFILANSILAVLTGAGCSTAAGIPDYRDADGRWKHSKPIEYAAFVGSHAVRQRYWARSMVGWPRMSQAAPAKSHLALAQLERHGRIETLVTQNVDGLHQRAGSRRMIDLHGRLDEVRCLDCQQVTPRANWQQQIAAANADWAETVSTVRNAPDGDAILENADYGSFEVPPCSTCGGIVKPEVVFFGENVPRERVEAAVRAVHAADALLVVGSSLIVYSGFRFARLAASAGKPVALVNRGFNRASELATLKLENDCGAILAEAMRLAGLADDESAVAAAPHHP